jgi:hypothetical protein
VAGGSVRSYSGPYSRWMLLPSRARGNTRRRGWAARCDPVPGNDDTTVCHCHPVAGIDQRAVRRPDSLAHQCGVNVVVLALAADLVRQASAAELRNAFGQTIWTASPLPAGDADSTGLTVAGQLLSPGRYVVSPVAGDRTLARLPFQVILR